MTCSELPFQSRCHRRLNLDATQAFGQLTEQVDCSGYPTRFAYDERGNLVQITDALGEITRYHYDSQGRLLQTQLADGRWMDSRRAARLAMGMLQEGKTLAVR